MPHTDPTLPSFYGPPPPDVRSLFKSAADETAGLVTLPAKPEEWGRRIHEAVTRNMPWLGKYTLDPSINTHDEVGRSAHGFLGVRPKLLGNTPAAALPRANIRIPLIIRDSKLLPPLVFECEGKYYGLTEERVNEVLSDPSLVEAPETPRNLHTTLSNQVPPRPWGNMMMMGGPMSGYGGSVRTASDPGTDKVATSARYYVSNTFDKDGYPTQPNRKPGDPSRWKRSAVLGGVIGGGLGALGGGPAGAVIGGGLGAAAMGIGAVAREADDLRLARMSKEDYQREMRARAVEHARRRARDTGGLAGAAFGGAVSDSATGRIVGGVLGAAAGEHFLADKKLERMKRERDYIAGKESSGMGSLSAAISGTACERDLSKYAAAYADPSVHAFVNEHVASVVTRLVVEAPPADAFAKAASVEVMRQSPVVLQVRPHGHGYLVKWADGEGYAPQQAAMSAPQAQAQLPQEMLQQADQTGAATVTVDPTTPDPEEETYSPITGFGMYRCVRKDTQEQVDGYVLPNLYDPMTNQPTTASLFTNGSTYAMEQGQIHGTLLNVTWSLPRMPEPIGLGVFYKVSQQRVYAILPVTLQGRVTLDGRTGYDALDSAGRPLQIEMSAAVQRPAYQPPQDMGGRGTLYIPADYRFLPLRNKVSLVAGPPPPSPEEIAAQQQAAAQQQMAAQQQAAAQQQGQQQAAAQQQGQQQQQVQQQQGQQQQQQVQQQQGQQQQVQQQGEGQRGEATKKQGPVTVNVKTSSDPRGKLTIHAYGGQVRLSGGAVSKIADCGKWLPLEDATFVAAATGIPERTALGLFKVAEDRGQAGITVANVRQIRPAAETLQVMLQKHASERQAHAATYGTGWEGPLLLKEAVAISSSQVSGEGGSVSGDGIDSVLSLGFLNDDNVGQFVNRLPILEDASSALAAMVYAIQLGYQPVPLAAAVRGMNGLDRVIQALKRVLPTRAV